MAVQQPGYSKEEFAKRGNEIYEAHVRPQVKADHYGQIVAIDIDTQAFELAENIVTAVERLYKRFPDAQPWVIKIGHRAIYRFGTESLKKPL